MSRAARIALAIIAALAVLLAINTIVVDNQTKDAVVTIDGGQIVETPGGALQVLDSGEPEGRAGAPIVLLHCYACSLHWWDLLAPELERNHRVVRIDLLGFGGSEKPASGYSIPEQAGAVAAALDRLGVEGAVVVGHSMGFAVATALAERASELVDRLVNLDEGPSPGDCETGFIAEIPYLPVIGEALWRVAPDALVRDAYESAFAPGFDLADGFPNPDQVVADRDAMTYTAYEQSADLYEEFGDERSLPDRLTPLAIPLLSIFGAEDQVCDPEASQAAYEAVPGARLETINGVGHSPNVEAPQETAELIERFAAEAVPAAPGRRGRRP